MSMHPPPDLLPEYALHLAAKEARVRALLEAHGLGDLYRGMVACPVERGYRTQASFRAAHGAPHTLVGVDPRGGRVPLPDSLWVLPELARPTALRVHELLMREGMLPPVAGFDLRLEHGTLRAHLTLSIPRDCAVPVDALCARLMEEVPELHGVSAPGAGLELGDAYLRNVLLGKPVLAHYRAFFQTNAHVTPLLCAEVQRPLHAPASVVDLYCGVGMHSLLAAGPATAVRGADNNPWAIDSAARNVALHGLADAEYHRVSAERYGVEQSFAAPTVVFVNPSRFGCGPGIAQAAARWRPERVCLVSCSIDSHVRDTVAFLAAGYRPEAVACFDMFPFSDYLESVTHLVPA
jgi:tRNA/tmRNA/rRNA uracil-C5-methylase (TrmA/RlmC/RlmD family)